MGVRLNKFWFAGLAFIIGLGVMAYAEVPRIISYQGLLTQSNGTPVSDGTYSIQFAIYNVSAGGAPLWNSGFQNVDITSGVFSIELGTAPMPPFPANVAADSSRYLGITVGVGAEITPRTRLTTSCFAFKSQSADTAAYVRLDQSYNSSVNNYGVHSKLTNSGSGITYGVWSEIEVPATSANSYAVGGLVEADTQTRTGLIGVADKISITSGYSYGLQGVGRGGYYAYGGYLAASLAITNYGVYGNAFGTGNNYGVYGTCGSYNGDYGGYFYGNLHSTGSNTKGGGGFIIDHPLDPENRYLAHFDVESPDMKDIYDGVAVLDANGRADIILPDYFDALNSDFRYQLTCIGEYASVYIAEEISDNRFVIAGGRLGMKISWQVTGIRKDAFALAADRTAEREKPADHRGKYLHPGAFGKSFEEAVDYINHVYRPESPGLSPASESD